MMMYEAKYMVGLDSTGEPVYRREVLADDILIECVAESEAEVWQYFVSRAIAKAAELRKVNSYCEFVGLECVAS